MNCTWDLSIFYQNFEDETIQKDIERLKTLPIEGKKVLEGGFAPQETLEKAVDLIEESSALFETLGSFSQLTQATDALNEEAAKLFDTVMQLSVDVSLFQSSVVRYVGQLENLEDIIAQSTKLQNVAYALRKMQEAAKHLLDESVEPLMLKMSLNGGNAFEKLRDMLDATLLVDYKGEQLPLSAVRAKAYESDENVRKSAYEAEIASYKKIELPMAACLNGVKGEAIIMAEAKGYDSVLQMTLDQNNMQEKTLHAMFSAIDEVLPKFRQYLRRKGELLGHKNGLPFYDLFAPLTLKGHKNKQYTIEEAKDKLIKELSKFSAEMGEFIDTAFIERWIDVFPKEGKGGGAFCSGVHTQQKSRVLSNFAGSFSDVSTLAHELGHAWHNKQLDPLPFMMIETPMPLAETASIFNETLLSHAAKQEADEKEAFTLLEGELMENTQTVVDIYSRYLFETEVIKRRKDHQLTVSELKEIMLQAQDKTYGDGLDKEVRHPYMWACKSHYYSPSYAFYNFPYAFGLLFGKGMFAKYLEKGQAFVPEYNTILSLCGSFDIEDVAKKADIDVTSVDFWRQSLKVVAEDIDTFLALSTKV